MRKIWTIAWKDLVATFTDRNLILIMILTPLLLATIIALAFGGGGDPDSLSLGEIPIAIVNQDEGLDLTSALGAGALDGMELEGTLFDLGFEAPAGAGDEGQAAAAGSFNAGATIVSILAPAAASATEGFGGDLPACTMVAGEDTNGGFNITLEELFAPTVLDDPAAARAGVEGGEYAAAILIPAGFTQSALPISQFGPGLADEAPSDIAAIEVYANAGNPIEANVVRSVVEGIVAQLGRLSLAMQGLNDAVDQTIRTAEIDLGDIDLDAVPALDAPVSEWQLFLDSVADRSPWFGALGGLVDRLAGGEALAADTVTSDVVGGALACLFDPDAGAITVQQQPLNKLQEQSFFERVMVQVGSAQAVFFALFTGAFGILSIYQERKQWTLQRMLASPTSRASVLTGFLTGNVIVVWVQLILLMIFLSGISSIIIRRPTFIWGDQWLLLLLLTIVISLCVSGLGVLIVGVARTPEQVQVFAPVINIFLGALGSAFGFFVPAALANLSLITWATDAYRQLAAGQTDIWLNLGVLALQGAIFFGLGLWFFRKRVTV